MSTGVGQGTVALTYVGGGVGSSAGEPITAGVLAPAVTYLPASSTLENAADSGGIAVGDFNGDGAPDAVLVNYSGLVTVYLNQGSGSFQAQPSLSTDAGGDYAQFPIVADVNGDGKADILIEDYDSTIAGGYGYPSYGDAVTVLLGNGDGSFQQPVNIPIDFVPSGMVAGDFNGDGTIDLAMIDASDRSLHILLGDGQGHFTPSATLTDGFSTYNNPVTIATGDFTGNGRLDIAASSENDGTVVVFLNNGDGTFTALPSVAAGSYPSALAVGDLNGDGIADIAVADQGTNNSAAVTVLLGNGNGTFTTAAPFVFDPNAVGRLDPRTIAIGDINNDGTPDLVLGGGNADAADIAVLLGNGNGTFRLGSTNDADTLVLQPALALADVNGDGRADVLTTGRDISPDLAANAGLSVLLNEPETVVGSTSPAITISRPALAQPVLSKSAGAGTLSQTGTSYTLNLGTLALGAGASVGLALGNVAAAPADSFDGLFSAPAGSGFTVSGAALPQAVAAGGSYAGLSVAADTSTPGAHSETITFAPRDVTGAAAPATSDLDTGLVLADSTANPGAVALELSPITLTVTDTVLASGVPIAPAGLAVVAPVVLPNVRVGAKDAAAITVANAASAPAANLDVTAVASGAASVSGAVTGLTPGATEAASLVAGLNTAAAGTLSGTVTLTPVSDAGGVTTPLATVAVPVSGSVFRIAAAQIAPVSAVLHVGDSGTVTLPVNNGDPADGFSESLIVAIASVTPGLTVATGTPTADIAPGATNQSLAVAVSTAAAGTVSGTATLSVTSDGGVVDGLGPLALPAATVPITAAVNNYARATLVASGGALSGGILNLGTVQQGSAPVTATLDTVNSAAGPADALSGSYAVASSGSFTDSGFASFSGDGAGQADAGGAVMLQTGQTGTFSQTIVLHSAGSNASGYSGALADQTVTVEGTVVPLGTPAGSITTTPASLSVAQGAPPTSIGIAAPADPNYSAALLTITAGDLPTDGTVLLADGVTPVATGAVLTSAQLAGLLFQPAAGQSGQSSAFTYTVTDPASTTSIGTATLAIGPAVGPVTTPGSLTVAPGQGATALGIQGPTDPDYAAAALEVTVTALPADGSIDLADGRTPITLGQVLGVAQLTGLTFLPATGVSNTQSTFGYAVADPAGNASAGSFTLAVGTGASGTSSTGMAVLSRGNVLSDVPRPAVSGTAPAGSTVTLLSNGAAAATVTANAAGGFTATPASPLPLALDVLTATISGSVSAASAPLDLFESPDQVSGVSIPDNSTRDVVGALGQHFGLELTNGTQQVELLDGTISVAPSTNEAYLARLYEGLFGRAPDPATGYADDQFAMGLSRVQVATEFLATPEGLADFAGSSNGALVSRLAQGLLGRAFSAADQSAFTNLLANGASRGAVLEGIADSAESQAHLAAATSDVFIPRPTAAGVYEMYETALGRDGDLAGVQYATNEVLRSGLTLLQVAQQITSTPEFLGDHAGQSNAAYVSSLYQDGLGRAPDPVGTALTTALDTGQITRGGALFGVASSPEAAAFLTRLIT